MGLSTYDIIIRITVSLVIGAAIGFERTLFRKPAGIRTHALVCIICTMLTIVSAYGFDSIIEGDKDPARLIANILTGIGFLCGGVIYVVSKGNDKNIRGLTTAAGIWGAASIGIPIGLGHFELVIITFVAMQIALKLEKVFKKIIVRLQKKLDEEEHYDE